MEFPKNCKRVNNCEIDSSAVISDFVNLYSCEIGAKTFIGPFVEIQKNVSIGDKCKIQSHSFICEGVTIEDEVFIGHGVMFCNDKNPRATNANGAMQTQADWTMQITRVCKGASIGSNATILGGITIGKNAVIGAGSVVTKNVPEGETWVGNPAKNIVMRKVSGRLR